MIELECMLACLTDAVTLPSFARDPNDDFLHEVFAFASGGDIQLRVNRNALDPPLGNQRGFWALDLHETLADLTHNPDPPAHSERIAVLFADYYRPYPTALGVMFDRGFDPGDDPSSASKFRRSPREGCAVFLEAIKNLRKTPARIDAETRFTTVHELGHVFNLQHVDVPPNYMAQSESAGPYAPADYVFLPKHAQMLHDCSASANVWPGGVPFGDTGPYGNFSLPAIRRSPKPEFGLELSISMGQREFWSFEPVELDVELRVANGLDRSFRVPDRIDAGYDAFDIWIEEPTGERRRYRAPRRYCGLTATRTVRPKRPFRRDISIFGEAGGYTFTSAGIHRLWTEFAVRPGVTLRSNELEVNVRPAEDTEVYRTAKTVLATGSRSRLLYHRKRGRTDEQHLRVLADFCAASPPVRSVGSVAYGLARIIAQGALENGESMPNPAVELLKRACDSDMLGVHQRDIAARLLDTRPVKGPRARS